MSETLLSAGPRTILRPEDAVRLPRPNRADDRDKPRASSEDTRGLRNQATTATLPSNATTSIGQSGEDMTSSISSLKSSVERPDPEPLSAEETIEKTRRALDEGLKLNQDALAGTEGVTEAVRPKLTIDLGHSRIARIPEPVVDLIRDEVERLSLSHNQIWHIPYRFEECARLKYLNVRANHFREFPRAVYKLPLLEILDISRNKLRRVPEEIKQLTSLRVLSLMNNRVEDLPSTLCEMNKLQILKVSENPLRFRLQRVVNQKESEAKEQGFGETERDSAITLEIKRFLQDERRGQALVTPTPSEAESGEDATESAVDTPKPLKRVLSSRFPVIPSATTTGPGAESPIDLSIKSPGQSKPPPIPTKSHYRIQSGQQTNILRRPGVSPLSIGSERNRSNSESVLQATAVPRTRRMAILRQEKSDLDPVEEGPSNRYSHLRGYSHASALRNKIAESPAESTSSSGPESPHPGSGRRMAFVRRLSSLPEHKDSNGDQGPLIEGAKGILYALFQVHPRLSALIDVAKADEPRRNSLDILFYTARIHIEQLNDVLEHIGTLDEDEDYRLDVVHSNVKAACVRCIKSYTALCGQLQRYVPKIISRSDVRYVRTTMLLLYGSIVEIKNACISFGVELNPGVGRVGEVKDIASVSAEQTLRAVKPIQDRSRSRPGLRYRSDTAIQHPTLNTMVNDAANIPLHQNQPYLLSTGMTGSTVNGTGYTSSTLGPSAFTGTTLGNRSRSNSRVAPSSLASSAASTPRSGDTFVVPPPGASMTKINSLTGVSEAEEDRVFEEIFRSLTRAYDAAEQSLPVAMRHFKRCLESAEEGRASKEVRDMWANLVYRCKACREVSETLHSLLINMKVKDPIAGRNQREFWALCKSFMQSFVDLAIDMRDARGLQMLPTEAIIVLRPVQKASREVGKLVDASPWGFLADNNGNTSTPSMNQYAGGNVFLSTINGASFPHSMHQPSNGASPVSVPLPATPLSAALGPAVQATVPSTPASAYGDRFFAGNVFERADTLLNMSHAAGLPLYPRRA